MIFSNIPNISEESKQTKGDQFWTLEFYGSCINAGLGTKVVLNQLVGKSHSWLISYI